MRDVTAILMGDPSAQYRRVAIPAPPPPAQKKTVWSRRRVNSGWLRALCNAPVGWRLEGISHYAAHSARVWARECGFEVRVYAIGKNNYGIERVR